MESSQNKTIILQMTNTWFGGGRESQRQVSGTNLTDKLVLTIYHNKFTKQDDSRNTGKH